MVTPSEIIRHTVDVVDRAVGVSRNAIDVVEKISWVSECASDLVGRATERLNAPAILSAELRSV